MFCIWGSIFRSFTSVALRGRGCWYWPYTSEMPAKHQVTAHPEIILTPCVLPLLHKRGVSEHKLCSWFLSRVFILPKVGPVVTMECIQAAASPPQTGSCVDEASKNLHFHRVFFPVHSSFVPLAFIHSLSCSCSSSVYFFTKGLE